MGIFVHILSSSIMSLNLKEDTDNILGRRYNVEYLTGNGKCATFNNKLEYIQQMDNNIKMFVSEDLTIRIFK